jgi:pyridinium-3,5-biscarboxylic acid mononucleotide synthase
MNDIDLDFERGERIGLPEIVYGQHKSAAQLFEVAARFEHRKANLLITRCTPEQVAGLEGEYDAVSRTFVCVRRPPEPLPGIVGVIYAGTSDAPVAREALVTLGFLGCLNLEFGDCGVAGMHRLLAHRNALAQCRVLICCAGFEGALPSVVAGLMPQPLIAVPTSVGYGVAEGGRAALHAMLASCASGVTVMNIDNGCGAAMAARRILNICEPRELDHAGTIDRSAERHQR